MQDTSTGSLIPLTPEQADAEFKRRANMDQMFGELKTDFEKRMREIRSGESNLPPVEHRGPIFAVGEILDIRGGRFRITKLAKGKMVLKGLPSL